VIFSVLETKSALHLQNLGSARQSPIRISIVWPCSESCAAAETFKLSADEDVDTLNFPDGKIDCPTKAADACVSWRTPSPGNKPCPFKRYASSSIYRTPLERERLWNKPVALEISRLP
jgi:hypothetical protein